MSACASVGVMSRLGKFLSWITIPLRMLLAAFGTFFLSVSSAASICLISAFLTVLFIERFLIVLLSTPSETSGSGFSAGLTVTSGLPSLFVSRLSGLVVSTNWVVNDPVVFGDTGISA